MNCHVFENEEENKLEYTTIYEQFVDIVERAIEAKLKEEYNYQDSEIEEFLKTFEDNIGTYKEKDPETVDVLYGFIDF